MASSSLGSPLKKAYSESTFESTRMQQGQPDEAARLRRGTIDDDLKAQMITRARDGRASVSQGYATQRSGLGRSTSEASVFGPPPSTTGSSRFKSGMDVLHEASATISPLRAGWRPNELPPMLETDNAFEAERTASRTGEQMFRRSLSAHPTNTTLGGGGGDEDGFDMDEVVAGGGLQPFGSPGKRPRDENVFGGGALHGQEDEEMVATDDESDGPDSPTRAAQSRTIRPFPARSLQATRSLPASGLFGGLKPDDFSMDHDF